MQKDKIKRFIDCYVPVSTCNLRCHYCYITQQGKFAEKTPVFSYSADHIRKALSKERLGGACCLNFCGGGETLIPPQMIDIVRELLEEGHYVMIVTNGILTRRFEQIAQFPKELLERLFFKFSFHYLELKRINMMEKFFANIKMMQDAGCSFTLEITPNDELIEHIEDIKKISLDNVKALPHITVARDNTKYELPILTSHSKSDYKKIWGQFKSGLFEYKYSVFNKKRKEFCYAGDWTLYLNIGSGDMKQCYKGEVIQNIYKNPDEPIAFKAIGNNCRESHCYNAHAFLTFGAIPEHKAPTYTHMRDRVCTDGSHWCSECVRDFFSQRLKDNNKKYSMRKKCKINKLNQTKKKNDFFEKIFSVKNECINSKKYKIITLLGVKIKLKKKFSENNLVNNELISLKKEIETIKDNQRKINLYLELERFDSFIKQIAPKNQMILVCINGLGDTMLYASYWRELEEKYGKKIFWVVTKAHEVVLKMYGITNYIALDMISIQKQGTFSEAVNMTTQPVVDIPFYAHWTFNKATRVKKDYFIDFMRDAMDLKDVPLNHPVWYPEISEELKAKLPNIKDFKKAILISPDARWLPINNVDFWSELIVQLKNQGFEVIVNDFLHKMKLRGAAHYADFTSEELVALSCECFATISPRSGFTDIIHELGNKLFVIYSEQKWFDLFTLNKLCSKANVNEYIYSQEETLKQILCDIQKLKD